MNVEINAYKCGYKLDFLEKSGLCPNRYGDCYTSIHLISVRDKSCLETKTADLFDVWHVGLDYKL
jgi:hypothetical protein